MMLRRWLWRRKLPRTYPAFVELIDGIPAADLATECECFADAAIRSKPGRVRELHWTKFRAGMDRLKRLTEDL
jgi:hypothetical protein